MVIVLVILVSFAYFYGRPVSYNTSLTLDITRIGVQNTAEYKYDDFYRIQADDKFAETVVEWLKSPRLISDIYAQAGLDPKNLTIKQLAKRLKPEKLSSQVISVSYSASDTKTSQNLARAIFEVISQNTQGLNKDQKEDTWFEVVFHEPVIKKSKVEPENVFAIALLVGIFLGFWVVMFRHYIR